MGSSVRHRPRRFGALTLALTLPGAGALPSGAVAPPPYVSVTVTGLRNGKGKVMACLTANPAAFPNCKNDPAAHRLIVPAAQGALVLDFGIVAPGRYALSLFHDENSNGKLDTLMLMPREGFGFSRDAPVRFGPPKFAAAEFTITGVAQRQTVRMRYML